tara:strand:+ start:396 stop:590 length:195 start_codon:yes stop_codon:yes gene_type:complete
VEALSETPLGLRVVRMPKLDANRLAVLATVLALVVITAIAGYRLEIGPTGLRFDRPDAVETKRP